VTQQEQIKALEAMTKALSAASKLLELVRTVLVTWQLGLMLDEAAIEDLARRSKEFS